MSTALPTASSAYGPDRPSAVATVDNATPQGSTYRRGNPVQRNGAGSTLGLGVLGLGALMAAGRLFVTGATGMAGTLGIDTYVIGALVVAVGTSLAELVTVVLSRLRGNDDIGVGTLIGSNLFNGLAIVGVAATIHPITLPVQEIAVSLVCGMAALLRLAPNSGGVIPRQRCLLLFGIYGIFIWATLVAGHYPSN